MTSKIFKVFITAMLAAVTIFSFAFQTFALPINTEITDNYFYSFWGEAVEAPIAYKAMRVIGITDLELKDFQPVDLFVQGDLLYIVDKATSTIVVLDRDFKVVSKISQLTGEVPELNKRIVGEDGQVTIDSELEKASELNFNKPEGIFVTEDGLLYVADTQNRRVVVCDINGVVQTVYQGIRIPVLGENYIFKPLKITVDKTGSMQLVAYSVNRGLVEIDSDGRFRAFVGAPKVQVNAIDWFWRLISTDEQKKQLVKYVPTEYNNIMSDDRGFIYATISTLDALALRSVAFSGDVSGNVAPVKKLAADGSDVLRRFGEFPPIGDLDFNPDFSPQIIDVAVDSSSGRYTILDFRMGRFFTYDNDGNLLYIGGGGGNQFGRLKSPSSLAMRGNQIYVSDIGNKTITVFETTDYVRAINDAVYSTSNGMYDESLGYWQEVINYNSNMYIAYIGLGKAELRIGMQLFGEESLPHYEKALSFFEAAEEKVNYSKAYKELRKDELSQNFELIVIGIFVIVAGLIALYIRSLIKRRKAERGAK